ncbi:MAG: hypothetical protein FJ148_26625 [Deltaproteobacteria bacterium]|nr:hypothetical protein [Deltaproteobacteria bacterium]
MLVVEVGRRRAVSRPPERLRGRPREAGATGGEGALSPPARSVRPRNEHAAGSFDRRYPQLPRVFGRLVREGRIAEAELRGLGDDRLAIIRRIVSL